jgi:hypothetical protein
VVEELALASTGVTATAEALDCPFPLLGSVDRICDRIREPRGRFGISYFTVFDRRSDGFDEVVPRLAGT